MSALVPSQNLVAQNDIQTPLPELVSRLKADKGCAPEVTAEQMKKVAEDMKAVATWVNATESTQLAAVLNANVAGLSATDTETEICSAHVLLDVALRQDSAALLRPRVQDIGAILNNSPNPRLQRSMGIILTVLRPQPPPEVIPPLLQFLNRQDRDVTLQAAAVAPLVRIAGLDSAVAAAVMQFWSRPLDRQSRQAVINGLGNPNVQEPRLVTLVVNAIGDQDPYVRFSAIQATQRIGNVALRQAEPALRTLAASTPDTNAPGDIEARTRALAREALREISKH